MLSVLAAVTVAQVGFAENIAVAPAEGGAGIARALEKARTIHRAEPAAVVTIELAEGDYLLDKPVEFGAEDVNLCIKGKGAALQCGRRLGAFRERRGAHNGRDARCPSEGGAHNGQDARCPSVVWEAEAPKGVEFRDLYVNGKRALRASEPNRHFLYMKNEAAESYRGFYAFEKDLDFLRKVPEDELKDVMLRIYQSWDMGYSAVENVDFGTGHVLGRVGMMFRLFSFGSLAPRYVIENCRAALDTPGEWFLDRKAGKVLYIPRTGEKAAESFACFPLVDCAIRMRGAKNVRFEGVAVEHVAWHMPPEGMRNLQAAYNVKDAAIDVQEGEGIVFRNCRVAHTGAHGIWISKVSKDCLAEHSLVEDVGASAVLLGDEAWKPTGYQKVELKSKGPHCERLHVRDSILRHGGRVLEAGVGVLLVQASDCKIVHNDIYDFRYTGVSAGWTWGYAPTPVRNNHIDFNRIHHIGQGRLSDMAGVYTLGDARGSTVCGNWITDVNGYRSGGSPAWGLYTDEGSRGFLYASNLVERCRSGAIHQHFGKDNVFANNILTGFDEFGVWRSKSEPHVTIALKNNIFYWTNPKARALTGRGSAAELTNIVAEANVWWPAGDAADGKPSVSFLGADWAAWRRQGHDATGCVADPLFTDPAKGDWRLRPESPALKLGFREFDWTRAGVFKDDPAWRAKADERTWDDFEDAPVAPRVVVTKGRCDFENCTVGKSAIASMNNFLVPFAPESSHGKSMLVTDQDPVQGKKCAIFKELPDLGQPWFPIISCKLKLADVKAFVRFSAKPLAGDYLLQFEPRDYEGKGNWKYVSGPIVQFKDGGVFAGGGHLVSAPVGAWTDVAMHIDLRARTWSVEARTRGGESGTTSGKLPKGFDLLTYVGFISYGKVGSEIAVDDIAFGEEK